MCSFSVGRTAGIFGCLLLLVGLVSPLYTIHLVVVELYPVTAASDLRLALCFVVLLCGAAYAVYAGRDLILVSAGVLTMLCTGLLYMVISHHVQALAGSFAELGGGASTLFGEILSGVAGYLINATNGCVVVGLVSIFCGRWCSDCCGDTWCGDETKGCTITPCFFFYPGPVRLGEKRR